MVPVAAALPPPPPTATAIVAAAAEEAAAVAAPARDESPRGDTILDEFLCDESPTDLLSRSEEGLF